MNIPTNEIVSKRLVGKLRGKGVWAIRTRGGLHVVGLDGGEVLGIGSHRAVARHISLSRNPDLCWTELSKAEHYPLSEIAHLLPEYEILTDRARKLQGR
jgi:hypothetical protein